MQIDLKNCVDINCSRKNLSQSSKILPQTYFLCNENNFDSFEDAVCELPNDNLRQWFDGVNLKTALYDTCNNTRNGDYISNYKFPPATCPNGSVCCVSYNSIDLLQELECNSHMECSTPARTTFTKKEEEIGTLLGKIFIAPYMVVGLIAVIGNLIVIANSAKMLFRKGFKRITERQIYRILILHLSFADCAMGAYVIVFSASSFKYFSEYNYGDESSKSRGTIICMLLGLINFASSQISVTAMATITGLRLRSVTFPYKKVRLRIVLSIVTFTWIFWIAVSCVPVINTDKFRTIFAAEMRIKSEGNKVINLRYGDFRFLIETILNRVNLRCDFLGRRQYTFDGQVTWNTLIDVSKKLKLLNSDQNFHVTYSNYYNRHWICTMQFFLEYDNLASLFTVLIILYNIMSFSFIFVAQVAIACKTSTCSKEFKAFMLSSILCIKRTGRAHSISKEQRRFSENKKMHRRMFYIVMTDFCCWIPLSFITLYFYAKSLYSLTCEFLSFKRSLEVWFPGFAMILLPINSAANPFIYSYRVWKPWRKFCGRKSKANKKSEPPNFKTEKNILNTVSFQTNQRIDNK